MKPQSAKSFDEIFLIQKWMEIGFKGYLEEITSFTWFTSRQTATAKTPIGELKCNVGEARPDHHYLFPDRSRMIPDAYDAELETTLITNRNDDAKGREHATMVSLVRSRLQMFNIRPMWLKYQNVLIIVDCRDKGVTEEQDQQNNLDISRIKWKLLFNINPGAWKPGL